jgi:nucleoid DNA-binding protein
MAKAKPAAKGAKKKMTKSAFIAHLAGTDHTKADVNKLYELLVQTVSEQLKKNGEFILPGIAKLKVKKQPAVKGGEKKVMPATGKEYVTKAKPASLKVKAFPVKSLKDAIN